MSLLPFSTIHSFSKFYLIDQQEANNVKETYKEEIPSCGNNSSLIHQFSQDIRVKDGAFKIKEIRTLSLSERWFSFQIDKKNVRETSVSFIHNVLILGDTISILRFFNGAEKSKYKRNKKWKRSLMLYKIVLAKLEYSCGLTQNPFKREVPWICPLCRELWDHPLDD